MKFSAHHRTGRGRRGFTLIELLVAATLSIMIMYVMSVAFQTGLATLSTLKSLGDMAERLKTTETMLRSDLDSEHFSTTGNASGTAGDDSPAPLRVSDLRYDLASPSSAPLGGFFQIVQVAGSTNEGIDADGLLSSRADGPSAHRISMTVKRPGRTPDQLFTAEVSGGDLAIPPAMNVSDVMINSATTANSRWAQVDWFLDTSRPAVLNGVTTWPLVRRVRLVFENPNTTMALASNASAEVVSMNGLNQVNNMRTIRAPSNRAPAVSIPNGNAKVGDDIVITNVTSFEVRPMYSPAAGVVPGAFDGVFSDLPAGGNYDTGNGAVGNNRIRVIAVQVKIRVYDPKNKLSRQTTLVVKM